MKIIKESKVEERFDNARQRSKHYGFHVVPEGRSKRKNKYHKYDYEFTPYEYPDEFEYETAAEDFAIDTVPKSSNLLNAHDPVGFMDADDRVHLYDPKTGQFTVYKIEHGEVITISYYIFSNNDRYIRDRNDFYKREIPEDYNKQITKRGTHAK